MNVEPPMLCEWVIMRLDKMNKNKSSPQVLLNEGIGYYPVEGNDNLVAFRRSCDRPLPDYLERVVDPYKIQKYEEARMSRQGGGVKK